MWNSSTTIVSLSQLELMINTLTSGRFDSNSQQCHLQRCRDARGGIEGERSTEITEPAAETEILLWAHLSPRKARSTQSSRLMDSVCCREMLKEQYLVNIACSEGTGASAKQFFLVRVLKVQRISPTRKSLTISLQRHYWLLLCRFIRLMYVTKQCI